MNYKIVEQVSRKKKSMSGVLRVVMIVFAVLFVVMGITISQAFMLPGFMLAGLYFVFDIFSQKDYEYTMENGQVDLQLPHHPWRKRQRQRKKTVKQQLL